MKLIVVWVWGDRVTAEAESVDGGESSPKMIWLHRKIVIWAGFFRTGTRVPDAIGSLQTIDRVNKTHLRQIARYS